MARILVVDDDAEIVEMLRILLSSAGYDVETARDGNEAVDLLRGKATYDLMLLDVRMSPINGVWLLSLSREEHPDLPVIMVTAYDSREVATQTLGMGAAAYVLKPFNTAKLLDLVASTIRERRGGKGAAAG